MSIEALRKELRSTLIERESEIEAALLALVSRQHVLLVGPPGTGKSMLSNGITKAIAEAQAFTILLTKFTTPEELFGPVKLSALREDRYERATAGYLPTAHIVFIDEIWKASSAILNTLLTALQERVFDNGGRREPMPLRLSIAASNEWPSAEDGQELGAIFDRYLIRRVVRPVSPSNRARLLFDTLAAAERCCSLTEIDRAADEAARLPVTEEAQTMLGRILDELAAAGIKPGDRRARQSVGVARAAAWLDGAKAVEPAHLECLADVLWSSPEQIEKCLEIVSRIANPAGAALNELLREVDELVTAGKAGDAAAKMVVIKKLEACEKKAAKLVDGFKTPAGSARATELLRHVKNERISIQAAAMGIDPEKAKILLGGAS